MGMVMDTRTHAQLGYGNYDPLRCAGAQFANPWGSTNGAQMYNMPLPNLNAVLEQQAASRDASLVMPYPTSSSLAQGKSRPCIVPSSTSDLVRFYAPKVVPSRVCAAESSFLHFERYAAVLPRVCTAR